MSNDLFFLLFFKSEPFYLSHTEGSYIGWGRGVTQERDIIYIYYCMIIQSDLSLKYIIVLHKLINISFIYLYFTN